MAGNSAEAGRTVADKVSSLLLAFTEGPSWRVSELARLVGMPSSTTHRIATELVSLQMLERDEHGQFRPSHNLRAVGGGQYAPATLPERAPPVIEDLCAVTGRRVRCGALTNLDVAYIEKQPGRQPASMFSSSAVIPAAPTALGRALLAYAPTGIVERIILSGLRRYTDVTVTTPSEFRRALAWTRANQIAVTQAELELGLGGVAMPVADRHGEVIAAIEVTLRPGESIHPVLPALVIATRSLERELSGSTGTKRADRHHHRATRVGRPNPTRNARKRVELMPVGQVGQLTAGSPTNPRRH